MIDEVNARIVYWGPEGSGKSANLQTIHDKLRPDSRGDLETHSTRIDPSVAYETLPIELGNLGGVHTRLRIVAPPSGEEQAPTRRQLLDQVDGIVLVIDTQRDQLDANLASLAELRTLLGEYGRDLADVPMVVQYNKRDLSDEFALEELHRKVDLPNLAAFEAVATTGTGVLQSLTTISKRVVRHLRENPVAEATPVAPIEPSADEALDLLGGDEALADPTPTEGLAAELLAPEEDDILETAELTEAAFEDSFQSVTDVAATMGLGESSLDDSSAGLPEIGALEPPSPGSLEIAQVGTARAVGTTAVAIPLVLRDEEGKERSIQLTVSIEAMAPNLSDDVEA